MLKTILKKNPKPDRENPRTNCKSKAIQAKSHKVNRLNFGMILCLFRYFRDAGYITLIVDILSAAPEAAGRDIPFSSLFV